ncbi:Nucleoside permease NupC [Aequoribacter fuscus]|jgi:CNT family concentrative nucleoside transporter|uniref:Nucleoside permease n=1 Tax=Aequoribacter fuscus TaxID=2518989 RepID=F3KZ75_9GAMM|nr:NupC/NupG family nucleoside CNT transporter [Aequoribacter fuscus]EGG30562.1 Nucleoside permease NupC [Aequoribacter fuscus]QHJ87462.1 NupC/NupG family nucleoside CNT transporter [Aequoribacter fuscus]
MTSLLGILLLPLLAYALSTQRSAIRWQTVAVAFALQAGIGGFVLFVPWGKQLLSSLAGGVGELLGYSRVGIEFLFGSLVSSDSIGFVFALSVLPVVVFFSSLIAVLYHIGVMQWVVKFIGGGLQKALGTSHSESLSAAANVFVGQAEAPLVAKPYLPGMTQSELFAVMVGGLASIAGSVMAGYVALGIPLEYLLAASFMAAPGALMMAKLVVPETGKPVQPGSDDDTTEERYVNVFDAAASGAMSGMQMVLAIGAMLLAFIALIALANGILGWVGGLFNYPDLTIQAILGYLFQPIAFALGIGWDEAQLAGSLIGQKLVLNEFVAYVAFVDVADQMSDLSQAIVIFALCGFANFSSIAILLGGIGSVAPNRRDDISRLGFRALLTATLANLMSAALAGFFLSLS